MTLLQGVVTLADGESVTIETHRALRLSIIPGTATSVDYSKVDSSDADAHDAGSTVNVAAETELEVYWPFYHFTANGGDARIAIVGGGGY